MADRETRRGRRRGARRGRRARKPLSIRWVILLDVLLFAASLLTFAWFHHVKPRVEQPVGIVSHRDARTIAPEATPSAEAEILTAEAEATLVLSNLAPGEAPADSPETAPAETPEATDTEAPEVSPAETPEATGTETPEAASAETPEATGTEAPGTASIETPAATPVETPEATNVETPEAASAETPGATVIETSQATAEATAEPTPLPGAELPEDTVGVFAKRHAGKFTDGEVIANSTGYRNQNVSIRFDRHLENESLIYYVADIYVRDIQYVRTAFASDTFGRGHAEELSEISARANSVMSINGDYYGARSDGIVIRNGELYRDDRNPRRDVCVLYWDGTMETYTPKEWDTQTAMENGAYQAWNFGPMLLDRDGQALTEFHSEVRGKNPRTAIGYFEPGHYCFVVVDGRSKRSTGMTLAELSELMHSLGCQRAYNLDGGQSSEMVADGTIVNKPFRGGRKTSDAILILPDA